MRFETPHELRKAFQAVYEQLVLWDGVGWAGVTEMGRVGAVREPPLRFLGDTLFVYAIFKVFVFLLAAGKIFNP